MDEKEREIRSVSTLKEMVLGTASAIWGICANGASKQGKLGLRKKAKMQ